jgi:hypothetical protein
MLFGGRKEWIGRCTNVRRAVVPDNRERTGSTLDATVVHMKGTTVAQLEIGLGHRQDGAHLQLSSRNERPWWARARDAGAPMPGSSSWLVTRLRTASGLPRRARPLPPPSPRAV